MILARTRAELPFAVLVCLAMAACGTDDDGGSSRAMDFVPRALALHAEPDPDSGGRIVDDEGREVLLRGVNVNALAEYWAPTTLPTTFPFTEFDADAIAEIGWNCVRLLLSWSRIEPAAGQYDEAYLARAEVIVGVLAARGIYTIVDVHQDAWGATLAARADEACDAQTSPAFGWDGAPAWATMDGGEPRCTPSGIRELSPAVRASFAAFWQDASGADGVGIRTRYGEMLRHLARRFSALNGVAGYDIMNEPNAFGDAEQTALATLYSEALRAIRAGETDSGAKPRLVLFEPSALWSTLGSGAPPDFARDRDVVYSPHIYTGGFTGGAITLAAFQVARDEAKLFGGAPIVSGEWGAGPERASDPADGYFITHQDLQDEARIGATLWTWRESCGDPHKAADHQAGRVPYVWGVFDVDCATNTVNGRRESLVDQLTRAYVRAAPGKIESVRYVHATGELSVRASLAPQAAELVIFYPSARHSLPRIAAAGLRDVELRRAPGNNSYITARSLGGAWSLEARTP